MTLPLSLLISMRFIFRNRSLGHIMSPISIIAILSITISVTVLIIGLSAMNGFEKELRDRILSVIAHGEIEPINKIWKNWRDTQKKIKNISGICSAMPYVKFSGLAKNGKNVCLIQIKGIDIKEEEKFSMIPFFIENKAWLNFKEKENKIIIGKGIANRLHIKKGEKIKVTLPDINNKNLNQFKTITLQVSGIFYIGGQLDYTFAIVPLSDAFQYLSIKDNITGIAIKVKDVFRANELIKKVSTVTNIETRTSSWMSTYGYIYRDIKMIRYIINITMLIVTMIACFSIIFILLIVAKDKIKEIAILRTLGAKKNFIFKIFFWNGLLIGISGSLFGIVLGIIFSLKLTLLIEHIEKLINYRFFSDGIYFINFLPSELHWMDIIYVFFIVLCLSVLSSWYPAYRASQINPVKILSNY